MTRDSDVGQFLAVHVSVLDDEPQDHFGSSAGQRQRCGTILWQHTL